MANKSSNNDHFIFLNPLCQLIQQCDCWSPRQPQTSISSGLCLLCSPPLPAPHPGSISVFKLRSFLLGGLLFCQESQQFLALLWTSLHFFFFYQFLTACSFVLFPCLLVWDLFIFFHLTLSFSFSICLPFLRIELLPSLNTLLNRTNAAFSYSSLPCFRCTSK